MGDQFTVVTQFDIRSDDAVRSDAAAGADASGRIDDRCGMDLAQAGFSSGLICARDARPSAPLFTS